MMRFRVLGPLGVERDGEAVPLTSHRQRAVLAMLLIAKGRTVSVEQLIDGVWGEQLPSNPTNTLQHSIAQLRKVLEPGRQRSEQPTVLVSTEAGYRLDLDGHTVDAHDFEAAIAQARELLAADQPEAAVDRISSGLDYWQGSAYAEFDADDFADGERKRLTELRLAARELLTDARLTATGPQAVVAELEDLVASYPHREGLWARLMTALYQVGRQADALRAYQRAATALGEELGILPSPELRALEQRILLQDPGLSPAPPTDVANNLAASTTSLIGREDDLASVLDALESSRIVTLLGPGGSGKTRLALEAARLLASRADHPVGADGIWLVRLDDLSDPSLLAPSVGAAIGMPESAAQEVIQTLVADIAGRRLLLILDNCEHLLEAVSDLTHQLITVCPAVVVLATSQAPLRLSGERRVQVPPLALPGAEGTPFARLEDSPAVRLFIDRAVEIGLDREIATTELDAIANIVKALDGIPLAIELAAARTDLFSPTEIARLLANRFDMLSAGPRDAPRRQQTLANAMAWSHGLLNEDERSCFVRMSVFAGGFDLEAAAAVIGMGESDTVALVGQLVARSMLTREQRATGPSRFRMLETLRQFGLGLLESTGEAEALHRRHGYFYAERAEQLDGRLIGPGQAQAFASFIADEDNMRAAMAWSLEAGSDETDDWVPGLRVAARSGRFWDWRGALAEANTWLGRVAGSVTIEVLADKALVLSWHGYFTAELGDRAKAEIIAERAGRIAAEQNDRYAIAAVGSTRALYARLGGELAAALALDDHIRRIGLEDGDPWFVAWADNHDALVHLAAGDRAAARAAAERSYRGFSAIGDRRSMGWALTALAQVALEADDHETARDQACRALTLAIESADGRNAAWASELAAAAARAEGDNEGAEALEDDAAELLAARGMPRSPWHRTSDDDSPSE